MDGSSSSICPGVELAKMQLRENEVHCSMAVGYSGRFVGRGYASHLVTHTTSSMRAAHKHLSNWNKLQMHKTLRQWSATRMPLSGPLMSGY